MAATPASQMRGVRRRHHVTIRTLTSDSSCIASVSYAPGTRTLDVHFKNGAVYRYFDVPPAIYDDMVAAPSKGRCFHRAVRGAFAYQRIMLG